MLAEYRNAATIKRTVIADGRRVVQVRLPAPDLLQEKPTNCGTKVADVPDTFSSRQTLYESSDYFSAFATILCTQHRNELGFS